MEELAQLDQTPSFILMGATIMILVGIYFLLKLFDENEKSENENEKLKND